MAARRFALLVLLLAASALSVQARPPPVKQILLTEVAPAPQQAYNDDGTPAMDVSQMNCQQANLYVAELEKKFSSMPLDLERVCISLRGAMQGGFAKCPGYKPSGTFGKLFRVCKVVTNNGALTCSTGADCTGMGSSAF